MLLSSWGIAAAASIFLGFTAFFLLAVLAAYYYDYKKNKGYYRESLVFWLILLGGIGLILLVCGAIFRSVLLCWTLSVTWVVWVILRLGVKGRQKTTDTKKQ